MKLIIQIPCYNEEMTLPLTLKELPDAIEGIDCVEWLIIDDGSTDNTLSVAKTHGVHHIVQHTMNLGLARAFTSGLRHCLDLDADIIVNTDADNQYKAADIPSLIGPILRGEADFVVGERPISSIKHFSPIKKLLQRLGSLVVRLVSKTHIPDAPSGFRAMSRDAATKLNVFNDYTYTLETIIQAGQEGIAITSVPIRTNNELRPSRLIRSIPRYIVRSVISIVRIFLIYRPYKAFLIPGLLSFFLGFALGLRFLYYYLTDGGAGHVQSVILAALLLGLGIFLSVTGILADLISVNRKLMEKLDRKVQDVDRKLRELKRDQHHDK